METVAAPARFRNARGQPGVLGNRGFSPHAGRYAQYGHATSKRGWMAGWSAVKQHPAAVGRAAFNIAVLSLLGWALVWFFASDRFYVSQIIVSGNNRLSADVIRRASGLQGYSSFWIHPQHMAAQITRSLPPITSVQVRHGLSNTVTLLVQEQEEQIMWQRSGVRYWVDEDGHLSPVQPDAPSPDEASGDGASGGEEGQSLAAEWAPTADWTLLVKDVRSNSDALSVEPDVHVAVRQIIRLLPEVRVVEYAPTVGLRFLHPRGWLVYLGTGSDMAHKVNVLRAIEVQFAGQDVLQPTLIDLRYPDSPYYRLPADAQKSAGD